MVTSGPGSGAPEGWIDRESFAEYLGERSERLLEYYDRPAEKGTLIPLSLNWLAILLLPAWFGYRRQWAAWATVTALLAGFTVVEGLTGIVVPTPGLVGGLVGAGFLANGLLLAEANQAYRKGVQAGLSLEQVRASLKARAAPSAGLAVAALLGNFLVLFVTAVVVHLTLGLPE